MFIAARPYLYPRKLRRSANALLSVKVPLPVSLLTERDFWAARLAIKHLAPLERKRILLLYL
jgi:hypothetical protein